MVSPKYIDLKEKSHIWIKPGEDLRLEYDFGKDDISGLSFKLLYQEKRWSTAPTTFDIKPHGEFLDSDPAFSGSTSTLVRIFIEHEDLVSWVDRTMEIRLMADNGDTVWAIKDALLTIAQGA